MRKRLKMKHRACALCKPHKQGWADRWTNRDRVLLREFERDRLRYRLR